jgi:AraC-like DNA-binding protein
VTLPSLESLRFFKKRKYAGLTPLWFSDIAGEPPARYAMTRRIERARHLLARHRFTNKELAEMLGFHDGFHFAKTFKKLTGKTPRQDSLDRQGGR